VLALWRCCRSAAGQNLHARASRATTQKTAAFIFACVCCEVKTCGKQQQEQVVSSYPGMLEVSDVGAAVGCLDSVAS
jgi:hypothetical protein